MKRFLLLLIFLIAGVGAGVGVGLMLGSDDVPAAGPAEAEHRGEHEAIAAGGDNDVEANPAEPARVEPAGVGTEYVRINNQFVVPIVHNGAVRSLVVLSLSLEVDTGGSSMVFNNEPRLRDSFLRVMFAHANAGGFDGRFTEAEAMAPLRSALREAAQGVLGRGGAHDVLITDITRQDA